MNIVLKSIATSTLLLISVLACSCERPDTTSAPAAPAEPTIDATPIQPGGGQWKIATSSKVTLTVTAPGGKEVKILYQPEASSDQYMELKTSVRRDKSDSNSKFYSDVQLPQDFAGEVWAEISYPDGTTKQTQPIALAAAGAIEQQASEQAAQPSPSPSGSPTAANANANSSANSNETKRAGNTGSRGQPDVRISVNVPAFRLTLLQDGNEIKSYEIGVGQKEFPIVIGERKAWQIIWNPEWVPPDSVWVMRMRGVSPGEHLEAGNPRNPLGKIKIPLGEGYLIHQTEKPTDIGHLVSHGCVRMRLEDLTDLVQKVITARALPVSQDRIQQAMNSTDRLQVRMNPPLIVDIAYETLEVENGVLHVYPDVYDRGTNSVDNLRSKLQTAGLDSSKLDDQTLAAIMNKANKAEEYQVSLSDIKAGRALVAGQNQPLTSESVPPHVAKAPKAAHHRRR